MQHFNQIRLPLILLFSGVFMFLIGCSSGGKRPEYMDASSIEALEVPPRLTIPDTSGALQLPEPTEKKIDCN